MAARQVNRYAQGAETRLEAVQQLVADIKQGLLAQDDEMGLNVDIGMACAFRDALLSSGGESVPTVGDLRQKARDLVESLEAILNGVEADEVEEDLVERVLGFSHAAGALDESPFSFDDSGLTEAFSQ